MRTLGFILGTLVLFLGTSVMAGTEYGPAQHSADSAYYVSAGSAYNYFQKVSMDSSGNIFISHRVGSNGTFRTFFTSNSGTSWTTHDSTLVVGTEAIQTWKAYQFAFGNQLFVVGTADAGNAQCKTLIRSYSGTTKGIVDTVNDDREINYGEWDGLFRHDDSDVIVYTTDEGSGTADYIKVFQSTGTIDTNETWVNREPDNKTTLSANVRTPFLWAGGVKGGIALLTVSLEDLYWADTTGIDTLSTAIIPNDIGTSGPEVSSISMVAVKDSFGLIAWQTSITASACSLLARPFHISNVGAGSGTVVYDSTAATLVTPGKIKSNFYFNPNISTLWGTDTVFIHSWYWPDTSKMRQPQIVRWMSSDKGRTWGSMTVERDSTGFTRGQTPIGLQCPPRVYNISNSINFVSVYGDSLSFGANPGDSLRVWISSLSTGAAPTSKSYRRKRLLGL